MVVPSWNMLYFSEVRLALNVGIAAGFAYLAYGFVKKNFINSKVVLSDSKQLVAFELIKKTVINHNTRIFR